ncbi:MAG: M14 family zinc carboxypeptidase [Wenzhouxiangella sp.]
MLALSCLRPGHFGFLLLLVLSSSWADSQLGLPAEFDPDPAIQSPSEFLGFDVGQRHLRHDQIHAYLKYLAAQSERVVAEDIGRSHEGRPLQLLTFAAAERLAELDRLRMDRRRASLAGDGPAVVWLGYAVHGDEASTATAAVLMAWYLAAARNPEVLAWLSDLVIVMEPVLNPDGVDRFAHWVNMHRGQHPSADPHDREHHEPWPRGRTNAYWFDLNRDWLPLVHPESQARMAHYHQWRPHVLGDWHEMGSNTTYFFQPGVPERNNPLTPARNFELTAKIAEFHARGLDAASEPLFTREIFDDYYLGKGSTFPDLTGGIGILFEQGSVRGHVLETPFGRRTFADAVANQVRTSVSTVEASHALADQLIAYQAEFFATARREAQRVGHAGWLLGDDGDPVRAGRLLHLLQQHDIRIWPVAESLTVAGRRHAPGSAWFIPADQDHFRFLKSALDPILDLPMETFYDVSTWPLGMAWNLPLAATRRAPALGQALSAAPSAQPPAVAADALAWIIPWNQHGAAPVLAALLADGYRVQVLTRPTRISLRQGGERDLVRGSLVIHRGLQPAAPKPVAAAPKPVAERLAELSGRFSAEILATDRGLVLSGLDLGSPSAPVLPPIRPALLVGQGLRATHAGYIWHWFDQVLEQPLTQLDWQRLASVNLQAYTHLILPDGNYPEMPEALGRSLERFVLDGGILIAARNAAAWVENLELGWAFIDADTPEEPGELPERRAYEAFVEDFARQLIGGSALAVQLDISHPLAFGFEQEALTVMRRGTHRLRHLDNAYTTAALYTDDVLASGYLSERNRERLGGTPALSASRQGQGLVVRMADDYLFRGYWVGTERLFANALFFGPIVGPTLIPAD